MKNKTSFIMNSILTIVWIIILILNIISMNNGREPSWIILIMYNILIIVQTLSIALFNH